MYRLANLTFDAVAVEAALKKFQSLGATFGHVKTMSFERAMQQVTTAIANRDAYIIDGYLVMVDEVQPWYTEDKFLQEWLVVKVYRPINQSISSIPAALEKIAVERGCIGIISADTAPAQLVAQAYKDAGFKPLTTSFYKVLDHGISETSSS